MSDAGERLVESASGKIIARQFGTKYPGGGGAPRQAVADIFERHGFPGAAKKLREIDAEQALGQAVGPLRGRAGADGLKVDSIEAANDDEHGRAFGVYKVARSEGERLPKQLHGGARVFTYQGRVYAAAPHEEDGPEIAECRGLADAIAEEANWLLDNARFSKEVSGAIGHALTNEGGAYTFISRGSYVAREGAPKTAALVALFEELRREYYNEQERSGLRCSAVAIRGGDEQALSDSILDDLEARVQELVDALRGDAGNAKTKDRTLESRRRLCERLLADLKPVRELCGAFAERLQAQIKDVHGAYLNAVSAVDLQLPAWAQNEEDASGPAPRKATPPAATEQDQTLDAFSL